MGDHPQTTSGGEMEVEFSFGSEPEEKDEDVDDLDYIYRLSIVLFALAALTSAVILFVKYVLPILVVGFLGLIIVDRYRGDDQEEEEADRGVVAVDAVKGYLDTVPAAYMEDIVKGTQLSEEEAVVATAQLVEEGDVHEELDDDGEWKYRRSVSLDAELSEANEPVQERAKKIQEEG